MRVQPEPPMRAEAVDDLHVHVVIGLDGATGGKGSHVVDDEHGQDRLDGSARDGGLVNTDAEQQVSKGVDEDNSPRTSVHDALERVGDARGDDGAQIGAGAHGEQGCGKSEDREVKRIGIMTLKELETAEARPRPA